MLRESLKTVVRRSSHDNNITSPRELVVNGKLDLDRLIAFNLRARNARLEAGNSAWNKITQLNNDKLQSAAIAELEDTFIISMIFLLIHKIGINHNQQLIKNLHGAGVADSELSRKNVIDDICCAGEKHIGSVFEEFIVANPSFSADVARKLFDDKKKQFIALFSLKYSLPADKLNTDFADIVLSDLVRAAFEEVFAEAEYRMNASSCAAIFSDRKLNYQKIQGALWLLQQGACLLERDHQNKIGWQSLVVCFNGFYIKHMEILKNRLQAAGRPYTMKNDILYPAETNPYPYESPFDIGFRDVSGGWTFYQVAVELKKVANAIQQIFSPAPADMVSPLSMFSASSTSVASLTSSRSSVVLAVGSDSAEASPGRSGQHYEPEPSPKKRQSISRSSPRSP